jgi:hypothetical protein
MTSTDNTTLTWRDTDLYTYLMLHLRGDDKKVEALRDIFNRNSPQYLNCSWEFAVHLTTRMNPGHGAVAAVREDGHPYGQRTLRTAAHTGVNGEATRQLTEMFATRKADWDWRVVFSYDGASRSEVEDLHTATRLHNRPVTIISFTPRHASINLTASPTLAAAAPKLSQKMTFLDASDMDALRAEPFFHPPK